MNYDDAIAVTRDIHWVGFDDRESGLRCNPYMLVDHDEAVLFDPGSIPHFPVVMRKVIEVVNPSQIRWIVAHHQDPDVCGNLPVMEDVIASSELHIVSTRKCMRLLRHYGLTSKLFEVDDHELRLELASGRELRFVETPFLHSPGAFATYDVRSRSLFSSDLFGAVGDSWQLFAEGDFLEGMGAWHREYMPSNAVLRSCLERLERMDIDRILPQHGSILEGEQVAQAIEYLKALPCGVDLSGDASAEG
ncbi:MAG: MBL fold metallo-hydrolase [Deltaproteobacteria bacterium]|nr:MBL fold metallo-hydrolase [Deltaproteobacteria bacterium]